MTRQIFNLIKFFFWIYYTLVIKAKNTNILLNTSRTIKLLNISTIYLYGHVLKIWLFYIKDLLFLNYLEVSEIKLKGLRRKVKSVWIDFLNMIV